MLTDLDTNKNLVRSFIAAWNDREFDRFDDLMASGAILHVGGGDVPCDPDGTRAIAEEWTTAFPDWRFDLLSLVAECDQVVAHMPYSGTFAKPVLGVAPTSRLAEVDEIVIFRIADVKIAEAWEVYDECGMWRQLGVAPEGAGLQAGDG
ncbi:MAG: ester cyclase [Nocardiopsaceae bacterium]|jgi:predicted ester cyclase|nr:ester cyclase [Nocardiopsaceae bacterium]